MTTNTTRILDVSPYNTFSATCSATVEVTGLEGRVQLRRRWQWKRRGAGGGSFQPVSDMFHTDSGSVSVLSVSETTRGSVGYQCRCDLEGTDNIHDTEEVIVSVISEYPNKQFSLAAYAIILPTAPSVVVESSPSSVRILNVPPYNQFTVTCTARAEVEGETVPLELTVDWVRRAGHYSFSDVPSTEYETTGSPEDGYQSTLTTTETDTENMITYRCRARLVGGSSIRGIADTTLNVVGNDQCVFISMEISATCIPVICFQDQLTQ